MKVEFYCGAHTGANLLPANPDGADPECGHQWTELTEEMDGQDEHHGDGESTYYSACPACGARTAAHVAHDPEWP